MKTISKDRLMSAAALGFVAITLPFSLSAQEAAAPGAAQPAIPAAGAGDVNSVPASGPETVPVEPGAPTTAAELEARKRIAFKAPGDGEVSARTADIAGELPQARARMTLVDAVRCTLLNDPVIQLAHEDVQLQRALLQILGGSFDWTLSSEVRWERRIQELDRAQEKSIQDNFDKQNEIIKATKKERKRLVDELNKLAEGQGVSSDFSLDASNRTEEADLTSQLTSSIVASVKELLPEGSSELSSITAIEDDINEQAIESRESIIETLDTTEQAAIDYKKKFPPASNLRSETYSFTTQLAKQYRNGVVLQPYATYSASENDQSRRSNQPRINRGDLGLELILPLGEGRGVVATNGQFMATQIELDASQFSFYHTLSERVETTVEAYWNLVAAQEKLALRVRSEITNSALSALGREMIGADVIPQSELPQMIARQLSAVGQRIQAEIELESAQRLLAVAMGLDGENIVYAPLAADKFPSLVAPGGFDRAQLKQYITEAFNRRNDRLSSLLSEDAKLVLVDQARRNLAPRADLFAKGFVSGQSEGAQAENWIDYYTGGMVGVGVEVGMSFDWSFANNSDKGTLAQRQATMRVQQLKSRITEQSIISDLCSANFLVHSSARLYQTQMQSMEEYGKALEAERQKFQLGEGTVLDVLQTEESLTVAGLSAIDARLRNAVALARLRHGTGTLLPALKADVAMPVERYRLTTPPVFADPAPALPQAEKAKGSVDRFLDAAFGTTDPYANVDIIKAKGKTVIPPAAPVEGAPGPMGTAMPVPPAK